MQTKSNLKLMRNYHLKIFQLITLVSILSLLSCSAPTLNTKVITEGHITFKITQTPTQKSSVLPNEMIIYFDKDNVRSKITGALNIYALEHIKSKSNDSTYTLLRVLDKKIYFSTPKRCGLFLFDAVKESDVVLINEIEKEILGISCKKALLTMDQKGLEPIEIFYTDKIIIETPNTNTPFFKVPGVMLKFEIYLNRVKYTFEAVEIVQDKIAQGHFELNPNYQHITETEMKELISSLIE